MIVIAPEYQGRVCFMRIRFEGREDSRGGKGRSLVESTGKMKGFVGRAKERLKRSVCS